MDYMIQSQYFVPEHLLADAEKALKEGRLRWRNTDAEGCPANGGEAEPLPMWEWSPYCEPRLCRSCWHTTTNPLRWRGTRVFLVECDAIVASEDDKAVSSRIRPLAEVHKDMCLDYRIGIRVGRKDLAGADLSYTDLHCMDLTGANLKGADLTWTNLIGANLSYANLHGANLASANLASANLRYANLIGANLTNANLTNAVH